MCLFFYKTDNELTIILGKAPNCNDFNFCGISTSNKAIKAENEVLASINAIDEKHIQFSFLKRSVNDKLFLKYFSTETFIVNDDYTFETAIYPTINANKRFLKKGK
jgi:hypothetical protein